MPSFQTFQQNSMCEDEGNPSLASPEGFLELDLSDAEKQSVKAINLEVPPKPGKETWGTHGGGQMGGIFLLVYGWFKKKIGHLYKQTLNQVGHEKTCFVRYILLLFDQTSRGTTCLSTFFPGSCWTKHFNLAKLHDINPSMLFIMGFHFNEAYPIPYMYGIFTYISLKFKGNVGNKTIHGCHWI